MCTVWLIFLPKKIGLQGLVNYIMVNHLRLDFVNPPLPSKRLIRIGKLYNLKSAKYYVSVKYYIIRIRSV